MTSPTDPPKRSIRDRVSRRLSTDSSGHYIDAEEQHTRNVTWLFIGLIVAVGVVAVVGLAYGFYESNLKPLANVDGTDIGRGEWEDRQRLDEFRLDRSETLVRTALAEGSMPGDLANRRLGAIDVERQAGASASMEALVDLLFKQQLAEDRGISVPAEDVAAAVAADGTSPEARRVEALVITTTEQQIGLPATPEGRVEARERAEAALAELEGGASIADIVEEYSPATADVDGDLGYISEGDITEPAWEDAIFGLGEGEISPIVEASGGEFLIAVVSDIVESTPDSGFLAAVAEDVGADIHVRNVELETIAARLEDDVTAEIVGADFEQVKLAEILIEGNTFVDPADDQGQVRASHILYQPEVLDEAGEPIALQDIADDDPAWADAEALAQAAATDLAAIEDDAARMEAFAERAREESDGPTGATGGDLGFFAREDMVPEFADAIFEATDPQPGDILGPVRSEFGWHTIMFAEARDPLADRVEAVQAALAEPGADFATVAAELSDGPDASVGGETGWHVLDELDDLTVLALTAIDVGETTEAVDGDRGFYIYQKLDEGTRPLEPDAAADLAQTAFVDWYDELRFAAEDEGRLSVDASVYADELSAGTPPVLPPAGGNGG